MNVNMLSYHTQEDEKVFLTKKNILVIISLVINMIDVIGKKFHFKFQSDPRKIGAGCPGLAGI
jgi:hypothetical protein